MRVIFQCRPTLLRLPGGDKTQILKTKEHLERFGVEVVLATEPRCIAKPGDILHVFNPSLIRASVVEEAKRQKIPVVTSTIHWDMLEYYRSYFAVNRQYLRLRPPGYLRYYLENQALAAALTHWWYGKSMRHLQRLFSLSDILLPNSQAEVRMIERSFRLPSARFVVVPNGVNPIDDFAPEIFFRRYGIRDFILCAGRIEYRKNQFQLLQALLDDDRPLVFIGQPFSKGYTALCKKIAERRKHVSFFDHMEQRELFSAYANARVHAMVSWYETPGLSSIEAALAGTRLAVSDRGSTREYFDQWASYCEPDDVASIRRAVDEAYDKPADSGLREHILIHYTWEKAAQATLAAYKEAQSL